jgi:hypothetical protein
MRGKTESHRILVRNLKEPFLASAIDGMVILKWIKNI